MKKVEQGTWNKRQSWKHFFYLSNPPPRPTPHAPHPAFILPLVIFLFFAISSVIRAAEVTTSGDIRAATNYASEKGWCAVKKDTKSADCHTQTTFCDANRWQSFVGDNIEFIGGGVPQLKKPGVVSAVLNAFAFSPSGDAASLAAGEKSEITIPDTIFTFLRKDPKNRSSIPPLPESSCFCECRTGDTDPACSGKDEGTPFQKNVGQLFTREECTRACEGRGVAPKCAGALNAIETIDSGSPQAAAAASAAVASIDEQAGCFSQTECANQDGEWEADSRKICTNNKGRCYAKDAEVQLNTPLGGISSIAGLNNYIVAIYRYGLSVLIVITTVMFVWGAFRYLLGSGGIGGIEKGKEIMKDSIIGMLLVLSATMILRTINPMTTSLNPLKVYLINTQRFIDAAYCKDLAGSPKLADAGTPPSTKTFEEVSKDAGAFSQTKTTAACGNQYFIEDASGGACTGTKCEASAETCVSCASGDIPECQGIASTRMVCSKQQFAGTIEYQNERYPEAVYLMLVCNWAQGDLAATNNSLQVIKEDVGKTAKVVGSAATDADVTGQAMYRFRFTEDRIKQASEYCKDKGGLRGALLGVQYNNGNVSIDNFAVLSKQNCSGAKVFDGYANGTVRADALDLADGIQCGFHKASPRFINPSQDYWSSEELLASADGRIAISCNFTLNNSTAPDNPGTTQGYCDLAQAKREANNNAPACASDVKNGIACDNAVHVCSIAGKTLCTCTINTSSIGAGASQYSGPVETPRAWQCE